MARPLRSTTPADVPLLRAALGYLKQARLRAIRHADRAANNNPNKES